MRLVLGLAQDHLNRADDALGIAGREQQPVAVRHVFSETLPEGAGAFPRQGRHEAYRRATFDAVDQDVGQSLDVGIGKRLEPPDHDTITTA